MVDFRDFGGVTKCTHSLVKRIKVVVFSSNPWFVRGGGSPKFRAILIVVEMTADFVVSSKIFVEVTVNRVCTIDIDTARYLICLGPT